jgi:hypothetical protein
MRIFCPASRLLASGDTRKPDEWIHVNHLRIPAKEIAHSDLMSIKIEASFRWTVIC